MRLRCTGVNQEATNRPIVGIAKAAGTRTSKVTFHETVPVQKRFLFSGDKRWRERVFSRLQETFRISCRVWKQGSPPAADGVKA